MSTRQLQKIGNSYGVILKRSELDALGLRSKSQVDVLVDSGRMVIERAQASDPIEELRACFAGVSADVTDAVIDVASRQARKETVAMIRAERKKIRAKI